MKKQIKIIALVFLVTFILYTDVIFLKVYFQTPLQYSPLPADVPEISEFRAGIAKTLIFLVGFIIVSIIATVFLIMVMMKIMNG